MAGDWIKMRADLFTHPKVVRISSALKADNLRTVGGLMSAWCLFDAHSVDGELEGYTVESLDDHLRWPGFSAAMKAVGWLEEHDSGLVLPRFDTHNGKSAKRRAQDTESKRAVRKMSASDADKKPTREEKRREDKSISVATASSTPPPVDNSTAEVLLLHPFAELLQTLEASRGCEFTDKGRASVFADWEARGITQPLLEVAHGHAVQRRLKAGSTAPVNVGLLDVILADLMRPAGSTVVALPVQDPKERRHRELQAQYAGEVLTGPDGRRFEIMSNGMVEVWNGQEHLGTLTAAHGEPFRKFWDDVDAGVVTPRAA
jgi:hypothetical protein